MNDDEIIEDGLDWDEVDDEHQISVGYCKILMQRARADERKSKMKFYNAAVIIDAVEREKAKLKDAIEKLQISYREDDKSMMQYIGRQEVLALLDGEFK